MKLEYELIEDDFDDTTHIRTMTEQAPVTTKGWLIRTTVYSPHHMSVSTIFIPGSSGKTEGFEGIVP